MASGSIDIDTTKMERRIKAYVAEAAEEIKAAMETVGTVKLAEADAFRVLWNEAPAGQLSEAAASMLASNLYEAGYAVVAVAEDKRNWYRAEYARQRADARLAQERSGETDSWQESDQ